MSETKTGEPTPVARVRRRLADDDGMPEDAHLPEHVQAAIAADDGLPEDAHLPEQVQAAIAVDPDADTGELPVPAPSCPQGRDVRRCRFTDRGVCGDCGAHR